MSEQSGFRILIIDDNPDIHADFRKILAPDDAAERVKRAGAALFGDMAPSRESSPFEIDSAAQGREALDCVTKARAAGCPYALAFVDVRMPPGWDGIETIKQLWQVDPELQVVICTAFSD
ncbi:MAG: PleD/VieA family response regulator, partial [Pedosphaera sp.]|nr:PleD/VieA family response regulator [Pedosphaera sp.]